jgi:hypothetical protein
LKLTRIVFVLSALLVSAVLVSAQVQAPPPQPAPATTLATPAEPPANLTAAELQNVKIQWLTRENRVLKAQQIMQQQIGQAEQDWQAFVQSLQREGYELDLNTGVRTPAKKGGGTP